MFQIPEKQIIVNDPAQFVMINGEDGSAWADNDVAPPSTGSIIFEGFTSRILAAEFLPFTAGGTNRVISQAAVAAVAEIFDFTLTVGAGGDAGDVFRITEEALDLTPTLFQNYPPVEKRYQLSTAVAAGTDSEDSIATQIVNTINADPSASVTAAVHAGGTTNNGIVELTAKHAGRKIRMYTDTTNGQTLSGAGVVDTAAALDIGGFEQLKNIEWAKGFEYDRNQEYYPLRGKTYTSYMFQIQSTALKSVGAQFIPNADQATATTTFKVWIDEALAGPGLITDMNAFVVDMNV